MTRPSTDPVSRPTRTVGGSATTTPQRSTDPVTRPTRTVGGSATTTPQRPTEVRSAVYEPRTQPGEGLGSTTG